MPVFQLILTSDTINEGRIKINNAFSATTGLWSGGTGFQSLIHNNGTGNIASGDYAIATGSGNTASGDFSFVQGTGNLASGIASHAEGGIAFMSPNFFYVGTSATTYNAHAEGLGTLASGISSHAEGTFTSAINDGDHSEGFGTTASGGNSHAEGISTTASGNASHAEGNQTVASGNTSHAEGFLTTASGGNSHAEGSQTTASGSASHAEGTNTTASGEYSHAEGHTTIASGNYSHAQGSLTTASGNYSFAGGRGNGGSSNIISNGDTSFAFYRQTTATPRGANADFSAILGGQNHYISSDSNGSVILGGEGNIIATSFLNKSDNFIVGSVNSTINSSNRSVILGGGSNIINPANNFLNSDSSSISSVGSVIRSGGYNILFSAFNCEIPDGFNNSIVIGRGAKVRAFTGNTAYFTIGWQTGIPPYTPDESNNTFSIEMQTGIVRSQGSFVPGSGADYAEYFEWLDKNPLNEDRVGYFVSLSGEVIEKGNYNLLGVVSSNPAIVGDASSLSWNNMWLKDEFGRYEILEHFVYRYNLSYLSGFTGNTLTEMAQKEFYLIKYEMLLKLFEKGIISVEPPLDVDIYLSELPNPYNMEGTLYTGDTSNFTFVRYGKVYYPNPVFKPGSTYIPREERSEWSPIGLLGKLHVRTSETITGTTVSANSDGTAINGPDYHVLKQVLEYSGSSVGYGVVQILFK
jgi:trimeric autotransporter adhesin